MKLIQPSGGTPVLRVVTREEPPYVMRCDNCSSSSYQGFAIDLLDAISKVAGFEYSLYLVPDNLYGVYDHETKEWNGIVRKHFYISLVCPFLLETLKLVISWNIKNRNI